MISRKLVETPVRMMNRMEEITDLICEYNEEVQKQQQEIERLKSIIKEVREIIYDNRYGHGELCLENQQVLELLKLLGSDKE